jgi:predicted transcriptional regulator
MDDQPQLGSSEGGSPASDESAGQQRQERLAALRAAVQLGLDDVAAGRVVDLDEGIEQVLRSIREKKAAGRHG